MCKWRQVRHIYTACNHIYSLPDEMIQCDDRFCKFSTTHPTNCGPNCRTTCWQYRQFPEQYDRVINRLCHVCEEARQAERMRHGGRH